MKIVISLIREKKTKKIVTYMNKRKSIIQNRHKIQKIVRLIRFKT